MSVILSPVNALDLSLITGGFTIAAVAVTFSGNYLRDRARDRRAEKLARDSVIADVLGPDRKADVAHAVTCCPRRPLFGYGCTSKTCRPPIADSTCCQSGCCEVAPLSSIVAAHRLPSRQLPSRQQAP